MAHAPCSSGQYISFQFHYLGIIDETGKRIFKQKLPNEHERILEAVKPYQNDIAGIVVESTPSLAAVHPG